MEREAAGATPRDVARRAVLRSVAWSAPVVLSVVAAPAMAASVGPLTVTATKNVLVLQLSLTFSGGQANLPVTIVSVTTTGLLGQTRTIAMSPSSTGSTGGVSYGTLLSAVTIYNYTVSYIFNGRTYTTVVSA